MEAICELGRGSSGGETEAESGRDWVRRTRSEAGRVHCGADNSFKKLPCGGKLKDGMRATKACGAGVLSADGKGLVEKPQWE